jgi:hypothetical protein
VIVFCNISSNLFGFDPVLTAQEIIRVLERELNGNRHRLGRIVLNNFPAGDPVGGDDDRRDDDDRHDDDRHDDDRHDDDRRDGGDGGGGGHDGGGGGHDDADRKRSRHDDSDDDEDPDRYLGGKQPKREEGQSVKPLELVLESDEEEDDSDMDATSG